MTLTVDEAWCQLNQMDVPPEFKPIFSAFLSTRSEMISIIHEKEEVIAQQDEQIEELKSQLRLFVELYELRKEIHNLTCKRDPWYSESLRRFDEE